MMSCYVCMNGWGYRACSPGRYDDANSTRLKVKLAMEHRLGGVGIFSAEMAGFLGTQMATEAWGAVEAFRAAGV